MATNKYRRGKIYKIWSPSTDDIYIGSTCEPTLARRMAGHRSNFKDFKRGKYCNNSSFLIIENGDARIELIESFPCDSKDELHAREAHYIRTLECVNKRIPGRKKKQYRQDKAEYLRKYEKQYRESNKEYIAAWKKEWAKSNGESLATNSRKFYHANKEKILERMSEKHDCYCGGKYTRSAKKRHERSKKHQDWEREFQEVFGSDSD